MEKVIADATNILARRMNIYATLRFISVAMLWGAGIGMALICVSKFVFIPIPLIPALGLIVGVCLLIGLIGGMLARISPQEAAVTADFRLGLKERLGSAVELLGKNNRSEMAELQLADAADYANSLDPEAICPHVFPITAKVLPLVLLVLMLLVYVPPLHGRADAVTEAVRQAIRQAGIEMEMKAKEMDRDTLSEEVAKLASEVETAGRKLQNESVTKKEALKNLSNLARKMEVLKTMGEVTEQLDGDMTPERKRLLNELLERLADSLRDVPGTEEISRKVVQAQRAGLSLDALRELSDALEQMRFGSSDAEALQRISEQVAKGKQDIGRLTLAAIAGVDSAEMQAEETSGLMGDGSPGKETAKVIYKSQRPAPPVQGNTLELDGQLSETGRSVPTEIESDLKKGESIVPYEEIYVKYRDTADDAITRTAIPWMYREHVKRYFDAIKPKESR